MRRLAALFTLLGLLGLLPLAARAGYDPDTAAFAIRFKQESTHRRLMSAMLLPDSSMTIQVERGPAGLYHAIAEGGTMERLGPKRWRWTAPPAPGLSKLAIVCESARDTIRVQAFTLLPYSELKGETLLGYRIGKYMVFTPSVRPIYMPPDGFIVVDPALADEPVSSHFTLGQFLCKQQGGWPKLVVLRERLLRKLERTLQATNAAGHACESFSLLSGYRTPWYNKAIGNSKYSRHVWGDAADIFIDEHPRDGQMDDLNGDGRVDVHDAAVLYTIIDDLYENDGWAPFVGGLGQYRRTETHGPFVHLDARGYRRRWGD